MSGTDQPGFRAPSRLTPIAMDQPIGHDMSGGKVMPTPYFAQMLQRILSYVGQPPTSGAGAGGVTISEALSTVTNNVVENQFTLKAADLGQAAQSEAMERAFEQLAGRLPGLPAPVASRGRAADAPIIPRQPAPARGHDQLAALGDVNIKVPNDQDVLIYNPTTREWVNGHSPTEITFNWTKANDPDTTILYTAPRPATVIAIVGRLEVPQGGAATISVYKAPNGTALAAGTILHTGTFNANGTAATNQTLTLVSVAVATLAAGDSIGILTTGPWTNSSGGLTLSMIYT